MISAAAVDDAAIVLRFIQELAEYEREPDAVELTLDTLREQLAASPRPFECVIARRDGEPVGFALYFHSYSTWRGRRGIYLEDLYVTTAARGHGIGRALLAHLASLAVARGCARLEWSVLDWNEPAIAFYRALGAQPMSEWTVFRLADQPLLDLASGSGGRIAP